MTIHSPKPSAWEDDDGSYYADHFDHQSGDESHDPDDEDEDPLTCDVESTGGHYEEPPGITIGGLSAHSSEVLRRYGDMA